MERSNLLGRRAVALCILFSLRGTAVLAQDAAPSGIRVCTRPGPGFFSQDAAGQPGGLEFDLLSGFASATGRKITFDPAPSFDQLLRDTEAGRCQIGASTVTVSAERKARFKFSVPYFPNRVVVVQKASTGLASAADLKDRRVAVVKGTISERLVSAMPGVLPLVVGEDAAGLDALLKDEAHAFACDSAVVLHHLGVYKDLGMAFPIGERSFFAFALPRDSSLVGPLDDYLRRVIRSGEFQKMLAKHFGAANAETLADDVAESLGK